MNNKTIVNHICSFDLMRIIAVCAVIMIHISADFVKLYPTDSLNFLFGNLFNSVSRFAVPMFLMISGSLMLNQNKELSTQKILKSTFNIFILLCLWSLIYSIGYNVIKPIIFKEPFSLNAFFDTLFNGHYHLWYLFILIGLYLLTPILRFFIKKENSKLIRNYLLFMSAICFGGSFLNQIVNICTNKTDIIYNYILNFRFDYIFEYLVYYILGWYLTNIEISKKSRIYIYLSGIIGVVATFFGTQLFTASTVENNYFYSNDSLNVFLYSIALFVLIHYLFKNHKLSTNKFTQQLSNLTFGVYLIHCIFLFVFKLLFNNITPAPLAICVTFICTALTSFISVKIISKIPFIKKLVRG